MFAGGIADKLGNRYEAKWLVRQFLEVVGAKAQSLRYEGITKSFRGFEFAVNRDGIVEWHQTKIKNPNGNWTLSALQREGVLAAFKGRLSANESNICIFVSEDPAKDIATLAEKARVATGLDEYTEALGKGHTEKFKELSRIWEVSDEFAYRWLKRSDFRTESESAIDSIISTLSDFYFFGTTDTAFEILREFLETRINKQISTESARHDLRLERKLVLKDWSIDPTLRERLESETAAYLETYAPFGAGGCTMSRAETRALVGRVEDRAGPQVILLTGVAGSGKSGVIREFIERLRDLGVPHLAFRIDQHLDCTSPKALGKAIIDKDESPVATLKRIAPEQLSVLIVDQVDAVSEVSGRNGAVKRAVLRLVDDVRNFGSIRMVVACRTFDLDSDQRLKALKESHGVEHINVPLLDWVGEVEPILRQKAIDTRQLSGNQRSILCLPLNLAIYLEVHDGAEVGFASRNDLFSRLLEKKGQTVRANRQPSWELIAPLSKLAEWTSERQRLDAPEDVLSDFSGALDILASEALIIRSRGRVNFFHESFFDYVYARGFSNRQQSLESLLMSSEQHLFRRTQVRQILETLRQTERIRYLRELRSTFTSAHVRYHIKVAIAQWLGSIPDPTVEEKNIILLLDPGSDPLPPLVRYALFGSAGWFDLLLKEGWISSNLASSNPQRMEGVLFWLSDVAGQRPNEIAELLDGWWGGTPDKGRRLLDWFGFVKRQRPDEALVRLFYRIIRAYLPEVFKRRESNQRNLLFHTWVRENRVGTAEILSAYFDAWFEAHPGQHPFDREFHDLDADSLGSMAKNAPEAFVDGSIDAFIRAIDLTISKQAEGGYDYAFTYRSASGHRSGADSYLNMLREALGAIAKANPTRAKEILARLEPNKHEAFTHIWLEVIRENGIALGDSLNAVLESPHVFHAGWDGAEWKSFADAAKEAIPHIAPSAVDRIERKILAYAPELEYAAKLTERIGSGEEATAWSNKETVIGYLNHSGYVQLCILETIGDSSLSDTSRARLAALRRKFPEFKVPEPHHNEGHWVGSPINRDNVVHMTDEQWLSAIERYDNDDFRRRGRNFTDGGAEQLAGELQHVTKENPARFGALLLQIPISTNQSYVRRLFWGLTEADEVDDEILRFAILNAHERPDRPYGSEITRLFGKHTRLAAAPDLFEILVWYLEQGKADGESIQEQESSDRELTTISDLLNKGDRLFIRGINNVRGAAAEALGKVLWHVQQVIGRAWRIVERRAAEEPLVSVRCCLMTPTVPLYNDNRERCAALAESLSHSPNNVARDRASIIFEKIWLCFAFPPEKLPTFAKRASVWCSSAVKYFARKSIERRQKQNTTKWWSPLITHSGTHLLPFLLQSTPAVGRRLIYLLVICGDDSSRMIGAWHVFRRSFQEARYAPLADALANEGVIYRRLLADIAASVITFDEYRYRAENILRCSFDDEDRQVRQQAANVFRNIKPDEFLQYRGLSEKFLRSRAFESASWAFFHALNGAECKVDDIVVSAAERLIADIRHDRNSGGDRSMDLHELQDIIKKEYTLSESDPGLRRRLLDLIDSMLSFELYGVDEIIKAHER